MREIHDLDQFDAHCDTHGRLSGVVVQGVELSGRTDELRSLPCDGATFLGCGLDGRTMEIVVAGGAAVFPSLPELPFEPYRPRLYDQGELLAGWDPSIDGSFARDALDSQIYAWASRHPRGASLPVLDSLARRLHDHAIDDALGDHLQAHPDVTAVMGGHAMSRTDPAYRTVAEIGRSMGRKGWHVATGGGPGAMEAANLGAWLAPYPDEALDRALDLLAAEVRYTNADEYLRAGLAVLDEFPVGGHSLAVPTWFYGHEPTNQFATHVAKYFANSIREDGLLAIATRGIVFAPGSAGTTQEVFQDATQNHYDVFGVISPMVFLDAAFWRTTLPAEPLVRVLAGDRPYASMIGAGDDCDSIMRFLLDHPPLRSDP